MAVQKLMENGVGGGQKKTRSKRDDEVSDLDDWNLNSRIFPNSTQLHHSCERLEYCDIYP